MMSETLATVNSYSGRESHKIRRGKDGVIYCDCWPWKKNRDCKHLEYYRNYIAKGGKGKVTPPPNPQDDDLSIIINEVVSQLNSR